jgi:hypothetical protein
MRTYELHRDDGYFLAFEIENVYVRPKKIGEVLSTVEGMTDVSVRKSSRASKDVHVNFKYLGIEYIVWEPFGDNSRYWIGPEKEDGQSSDIDISPLAKAFRDYEPPFLVKVFGDLITLNFKSIFST